MKNGATVFAPIFLIGFIVVVFALIASGCGDGSDSKPIPALVAAAPIIDDPTPTPTGRAVYAQPQQTPTPFGGFGSDGERVCDDDDDDPSWCERGR